jgi:glutamate-1-semialdehyde 2,1-aminomutase
MFERACRTLVGGVDSPVRAYRAVGGVPPFIASASGATITDIDGNTYIDYVGSWGPAILGHARPEVTAAIAAAASRGASFGAPTEGEVRLAELVRLRMPSIERIRFTSSGTEAVMSAIRLARGATGRDKIVKCVGCYHGHADSMLVSAGSGALTLGVPSSPGVPAGAAADTLLVPYNDAAAVAKTLDLYAGKVAAVLVEPVAGNVGVIPPAQGYLAELRRLCDRANVLLIFDEVITGFRIAPGGAQELYRVRADLTTLGKIIGGGMPVGAFGGRRDIMDQLAPQGPVYQAGTLSGNPVAMAAGLTTLELLTGDVYRTLEARSARLEGLLRQAAATAGAKCAFTRVGSMMCCFFTPGPVDDYASATRSDARAYAAYFHAMLGSGVYLAPSQFEAMFVSAAHDDDHLDATAAAAREAFAAAARAAV